MKLSGLFFVVVFVLTIGACAKTGQRTDISIPNSGFLGAEYYAKLTPGDEDNYEPALRWYSPEYDITKYDKLMLDPILIYRGKEGKMDGIAPEDAQRLADYFYNTVYTALQDDIQMVDKPGAKTLRLTVAVTTLEQSNK